MTISHKILKALLNGPRTVDEIATETQEERKRIVSNFGPICHSKLVTRIPGLDGTVEYKITPAGLAHYERNGSKSVSVAEAATTETTTEISETTTAISETTTAMDETATDCDEAIAESSILPAPMIAPIIAANPIVADYEAIDSEEIVLAPEAPPFPRQFAICRAGQTPKTAWEIHEMDESAARQLAMDDATAVRGEVILYCLVPVGRAVTRVVFEDI